MITLWSRSFSNTWKIVKPNQISDSEVRITDISVRSALMRVRWNDMPVRRDDSSTEIWSESDLAGDGLIGHGSISSSGGGFAREPPARDALDDPSEDEVGNDGEQERHHRRLRRDRTGRTP